MTKNLFVVLVISVAFLWGCAAVKKPNPLPQEQHTNSLLKVMQPEQIRSVMARVADWQLTNPSEHHTAAWTHAALFAGMTAWAQMADSDTYYQALLGFGEKNNWQPHSRIYHADDHAVAQMYIELYKKYKDPKMIAGIRQRFDYILANQPDTPLTHDDPEHKKRYNWCDALFMAPPVWAKLARITGETKYLDYMNKEWWVTTDYLYDTEEHLYFRDDRYFDKREANGKKVFWSRGNGWVLSGYARVLEELPEDYPDHDRYVKIYKQMAAKLVKVQPPGGLWHSSLLDPVNFPSKEASGSGFYCYALAWGINRGLLDVKTYLPAVKKAWLGLVNCVHPDGKLGNVQPIGADPRHVTAEQTEIYGVGAFLLAGSEVYKIAVRAGAKVQKKYPPPFGDRYNIVWETQSENSSESMPVVGGDTACNVWAENGDLLFYMSRSGSFDENGCYHKLGRIRIKLSPNPFANPSSFKQELKLKDGFVEIEGNVNTNGTPLEIKIKVWVEVYNPVIHVDIDANQPIEIKAAYESWRFENKELTPGNYGERFTIFNLMGYPGKVIKTKDDISFFNNGVLFYHRNPEKKLTPDLLIKQQGLAAEADNITDDLKNRTFGGFLFGKGFVQAGKGSGSYMNTPFYSWIIRSKKPQKNHRLFVATHIEQAESIDHWKKTLFKSIDEAPDNHSKALKKTTAWWNEFWNRSWIVISPDIYEPENPAWQMARNYQLFRYQLGGNVFGEYPTKFNGGSLTFDPVSISKEYDYGPDWRKWGGNVFTAQNQRLVYWPMLKSGDFDVILPQVELYRKGLPGATARVRTHFGHEGAVYCEYTSVPGIPIGDGWGWKGGSSHRQRGNEIPFGDSRADALKGFGDLVEKGVMANRAIAYHWESQVEHAYMILEYHRFTGAAISSYMPFIEQSLIFFDKHYRMRQKMRNGQELDDKGKLVIYPSTSCESYRGAKNPSDLIAGLKACVEALLELDEKYLSGSKKDYYRDFLSHIPDLSYGEEKGDKILKPAESWGRYQNVECPQFYPLFPFNRFSLVNDDMTVFKNTWKHGTFKKNMVQSWHQDGIFFARMGMTEEAADFNTRKLQDSKRKFPTFWGPGHDWVPDHNWGGSGMIGLQEMLMQTIGDKIVLFPAWPKEWDVDFKLHAPKNTTVEGRLENGQITKLKVVPESRSKDVVVADFLSNNNK